MTTKPQIFSRQSSGLVRDWSVTETMIYNVLTITLYGALTLSMYTNGPGIFAGGHVWLAVLITTVFGCIHSTNYALLGTAMPRSGGEYVFLTRTLEPGFASAIELGAWVFGNILSFYWCAWMFANVAMFQLGTMLGIILENPALLSFGAWCGTTDAMLKIGVPFTLVFMLFGMLGPTRNYMRLQWILIVGVIVGFFLSIALFATTSPASFQQAFNTYMLRFQSDPDFYSKILTTASTAGYQVKEFDLMATLGICPIVFTQLCWGYWSAWNLGEIKGSDRAKTNVYTMVGSTIIVGILLAIIGIAMESSATYSFLSSAGYLTITGDALLKVLPQPMYYPFLSAVVTTSPILVFLVAFSVICQTVQIVFNPAFGATRVLVTASLDRVVPDVLGRVNIKVLQPLGAWLLVMVGAIANMVLAFSSSQWLSLQLNFFYTSTVAFLLTSLAAMIFPYRRPSIYNASPLVKWKVGSLPVITIFGFIGLVWNAAMIYFYLTVPQYGYTVFGPSLMFIVGVFVACYIYYQIRRAYLKSKGIQIELAFAELPPA